VPALELARPTIDLGLFSDNPAMGVWYQEVLGLAFVEGLQHSPTYSEDFYAVNGRSLKINASEEPMAPGTSGYRGLLIARDGIAEPQPFVDPDGLAVTVVPRGHAGVDEIGIVCDVADVDAEARFLLATVATRDAGSGGGLRVGDTVLFLRAAEVERPTPTWRRGFNYYLLSVPDVVAAHQLVLDHGAEHSAPPVRLAERCVFSWVRAPSGNWIELVQYADVAPLPDVPFAADRWPEITRWRETGEAYWS
jgi:Glyoxalase/Bleomycin resistance protein/Dioxygenase superfamily